MKLIILPFFEDGALIEVRFVAGTLIVPDRDKAKRFLNNRAAYAYKRRYFSKSPDLIVIDELEVQGYLDRALVGRIINT